MKVGNRSLDSCKAYASKLRKKLELEKTPKGTETLLKLLDKFKAPKFTKEDHEMYMILAFHYGTDY